MSMMFHEAMGCMVMGMGQARWFIEVRRRDP